MKNYSFESEKEYQEHIEQQGNDEQENKQNYKYSEFIKKVNIQKELIKNTFKCNDHSCVYYDILELHCIPNNCKNYK